MIADYRTAPIDEKLRAVLALLEKVTLTPGAVGPDDVRAVLALGATREQVRDALYVAFLFNTYDRLSDTLGWAIPSERYFTKAGRFLLKKGYR